LFTSHDLSALVGHVVIDIFIDVVRLSNGLRVCLSVFGVRVDVYIRSVLVPIGRL